MHRWLLLLTLILSALAAPPRVAAQSTTPVRLSDQEPFDRITLNEDNQGAVIKVEPIDLPGRRVPAKPNPEDRIRVKLYAQPDKTYEIAWKHIVKVELFEDMLLAEVQQFMSQDKLDDAYDALQFLKKTFPQAPGLDAQIQAYLYVSAGRLFRQQRWSEALVALEELRKLNPDYKLSADARPLSQVLAGVLDKIIGGYVAAGDYRAARMFLARIESEFGSDYAPTVTQWQQQLQGVAGKERDSARELMAAGKLRDANRAIRRMNAVWPSVEGGETLAADLAARYPMIAVGVTQLASSTDFRRVDDWAARRAGRLTTRQLIEFLKPGAEGGQYAFRYGSLQISEDRRRMTLQLASDLLPPGSPVTGYDLARRLLSAADRADPDYSVTWARMVKSVSVGDVMRAEIELRGPFVVPQAALQLPWSPAGDNSDVGATGSFRATPIDGNDQPFVRANEKGERGGPAEITERHFEDPAAALAALRRADVDVIDRVFPADVANLSKESTLVVQRYTLPTLHFLIPSPTRPLAQNSTIRRAIAYAIPRDKILNEQLLGGTKLAGCRIISGPFSPGVSDNDPLAYASDTQIAPRPYDARLAATLIGVVQRQRKDAADKAMKSPEPLELILGHSQSEVARVACQSIAEQLTALGMKTTLLALPGGETRDLRDECDFTYAEAVLSEPLVDARRLLGPDGAARSRDPYLNLALRRLDEATNWTEARSRLKDVHRIVHSEMNVIPLWQLVEHYAYRKDLTGLDGAVVSLYQDVDQWRRRGTVAPTARAEANR